MTQFFKQNFNRLQATLSTEEQLTTGVRASSLIEGTNSYNRRETRIRRHYANHKSYLRISSLHLLALYLKWQQPYMDPDNLKQLMNFYSVQTSEALNVAETILKENDTANEEEFKDTNILYLSANFHYVQIDSLTVTAALIAVGALSDGKCIPFLSTPLLPTDREKPKMFIRNLTSKYEPNFCLSSILQTFLDLTNPLERPFPRLFFRKYGPTYRWAVSRLPEKQRKNVRPHLKKLFESQTRNETLHTPSWIKRDYLYDQPKASRILQSRVDESELKFTFLKVPILKKL